MEELVQFGLSLLDSEVEKICPLIYLISLATFYFKILLLVGTILVKQE